MKDDLGYIRLQRRLKIDPEFCALTRDAQWLYETLLLDVDFVGIADWRPKKLAKRAADTTADVIDRAAAELTSRLFIIVDEDTDEVFVRTFMKHDGLYKQPNMCKAMVKAFMSVGSPTLRSMISHELNQIGPRLRYDIEQRGLSSGEKKSEHDKLDRCWHALNEITSYPQINPAAVLEDFNQQYDKHFEGAY
ncbi:helix-turn-helix DNA binding domain protein [Arthrobacter phage Sicarius2]|uniref:Helix-turn-helix DNA binding domain protein n=1 Tax=Arthrobacter phage Sicarius2 TaxID=2836090 RepID=A0A8F3E5Q8_9CAUD|nr:helix-turn-helix DNA binding domain protein [Arthrobacter phage Sicarius2]